MRILLTNDASPDASGSDTTYWELEHALAAAGHEVRCLAAEPDVFAVPSDEEFYRRRQALRVQLDALIEAFDPHVVHSQHAGLLAHLSLESGAPYVVTAHSATLSPADPRLRPLAEQAAENAGAVLAHTEHLAGALRAALAVADVQVVALPPGISRSEARISAAELASLGIDGDGGPLIAFAGALAPPRSAATLLNAAAIYEGERAARTVIAGDGPLAVELQAQASRLALQRTRLIGPQSRFACRALVAAADLVVVPSHGSASLWTVLEALSAGTPVVATTGDGREEILSGDFGALVPPDDHELLADAVLRALAENWKRTKGPLAAAHVAEHHNPHDWAERLFEVYRRVLGERGGSY